GGGERLPNELQSVEPVEPVQVRVVAQTRRRGDEMAKTGRIPVGWARPDSNRRSSLCESDVVTAGPRARRFGEGRVRIRDSTGQGSRAGPGWPSVSGPARWPAQGFLPQRRRSGSRSRESCPWTWLLRLRRAPRPVGGARGAGTGAS